MKKEQLEAIKRLRPIDDVLFEVLADDVAFCEEMLRTILEDKTLVVEDVIVQSSQRNLYGRSVRLDALCTMGDGTKCNVEVQRADDDDHLRRARYNASVITAKCTEPGEKFKDVPTVKVIYISEHDFLRGNKTIYHIDQVIRETGNTIDDGYSLVLVNTAIDDGTDIADLMRCMIQTEVRSDKFPVFTSRLDRIKNTEGGQLAMCKVIEELVNSEVKDERRNVIRNIFESGDFTIDKIAEMLRYSIEEVEEALKAEPCLI